MAPASLCGMSFPSGRSKSPSTGERRRDPRGQRPGEPHRQALASTILGSYSEMPGLSLRLEQAARLFGIRLETCQVVLEDLVRAGQLQRRPDGQYTLGSRH
jgi:hypothetical protein